jgi:predicted methyltransferase
MDGVCQSVMNDEAIQEKMANPILDIVHKQVVMVLYSLEANKQIDEYKELLPVYLSTDWSKCAAILDAIEQAGLLIRTDGGIQLTHQVEVDTSANSCACHA